MRHELLMTQTRRRAGRTRIPLLSAALLGFLLGMEAVGSAPGGESEPKLPARVVIRGRITNGTKGSPASVPKLELIDPSGGMRPIAVLENTGPTFRFEAVDRPQGPLLVRAHFLGETYVKMVPPAVRFWNREQTLEVFDTAPLPPDLTPRAALQVTKERGRLLISRIVAIHNQSRTTYKTDTLIIPVPTDAVDLKGSLQQEGSQMPVPLTLERTEAGVRIGRGLRPGNAAVTLEYSVPGTVLHDSLPRNTRNATTEPQSILWWRPADARPRVTGGTVQEMDTGKLGQALRIQYPRTGSVTLDFSAGGFAPPSERFEANPIFDSRSSTTLGLILFALAFLAIAAVAVGSGFRLVRAPSATQAKGGDAPGSGD